MDPFSACNFKARSLILPANLRHYWLHEYFRQNNRTLGKLLEEEITHAATKTKVAGHIKAWMSRT
jgi:hypothetical protein